MFKTFAASTFIVLAAAADLPYNPSSFWVSTTAENHTVAYFISSTSNEVRFQYINLTRPFDAVSPSFSNIASPPFSPNDAKSIIPIADPDGIPTIYAGDCRSSKAEVWRFETENTKDMADMNGKWLKSAIQQKKGRSGMPWRGPNYLAAGIGFSTPESDSAPDIYVFAGMCPTDEIRLKSWIADAEYSRNMTYLQTEMSSPSPDYNIEKLSIRSPPVAEAGFSMTPLVPAYSNSSTGARLRHQSFVLAGGHTQSAFVNMSQIALFSLPEESWSYVTVNQELSDSSQARLPEGISGIEPRSGHTAVLTPDGSKIVIFGGWVGDTSVPAQPQLAILDIGEDYGGSGDWTWEIPKSSPDGLPENTGVFGHGAAMLPGNVMLITGGYRIPPRSFKRTNNEFVANDQTFLFNTTSGTWVTSYTPPDIASVPNEHHRGPLSTTLQKVGLGVGLGVGVPVAALAAVLVFFVCRNRRAREHRKTREQTLRSLALGAERPHFEAPDQQMMQLDSAQHYGFGGYSDIQNSPFAAERTGLLVDNPSPTRGLRASVRSRGYQPGILQDDPRRNIKFSQIQPIDEGEEYDAIQSIPAGAAGCRDSKCSSNSDPFKDPPSPSKDCFPSLVPEDQSRSQTNDENIHEWVHTLSSEKLEKLEKPPSITSEKQDRTLSNLSGTSGTSSSSHRTNPKLLDRSVSQRSNFGNPSNFGSSERGHTADSDRAVPGRVALSGRPSSQLSYAQLQAEGSSLLGTNPSWMPQQDPNQPADQRQGPITLELAGTIRRVLGSLRRSETSGGSNKTPNQAEPRASNQRSSSTSPTKSFYSLPDEENQGYLETVQGASQRPHRAVSTSSSVLRRKQGAKDWNAKRKSGDSSILRQGKSRYESSSAEVGSAVGGASYRSSEDDYDFDDEDWDVEAAAEGRVVQVTFTVPKERLRVVNAGAGDTIDDDDERDEDKKMKQKQVDTNYNDHEKGKGKGLIPVSESMRSIDDVFTDAPEESSETPTKQ
ncbi:hypothetical protein H109_07151 [Trichophyton interdigitale MR816]|uniref:Galactose oxidase n=1 Tax=Trichophyton interdigitale (strain MR816) TaxID=1215338 RepID=A0A059IZ29_TRIIM|nr:hypothetical protein H101_05468 [Trichophyton interdigitale H6]KDB20886.1 hypothetical protein H109_07151 [Trichophyton interdigitale MR816]